MVAKFAIVVIHQRADVLLGQECLLGAQKWSYTTADKLVAKHKLEDSARDDVAGVASAFRPLLQSLVLKDALSIGGVGVETHNWHIVPARIAPRLVKSKVSCLIPVFADFLVYESLDLVPCQNIVAVDLDLVRMIQGTLLDPRSDF